MVSTRPAGTYLYIGGYIDIIIVSIYRRYKNIRHKNIGHKNIRHKNIGYRNIGHKNIVKRNSKI